MGADFKDETPSPTQKGQASRTIKVPITVPKAADETHVGLHQQHRAGLRVDNTTDTKELFQSLVQLAGFDEYEQINLMQKYEDAVLAYTMGTLLELLPSKEQQKMEQLMKLRPQDFMQRALIILQAITDTDQVLKVLDKTAENAFVNFFDAFLMNCNTQQKKAIEGYLQGA